MTMESAKALIEELTVDEIERIILQTEPPALSDRSDKIWTRRMATKLAEVVNSRLAALSAQGEAAQPAAEGYQSRVHDWMMACFNDEIAFSRKERNHRFLEEALELVQAMGCTRSEAYQLVDYVFDRPTGDPVQEVGGVIVCLAALCTAAKIDMDTAGETELARIWTKVEKIRAKHAAKPRFSPLPGASPNAASQDGGRE
jgi:hypothetical protein